MTFWMSVLSDRGWNYGPHHAHAATTSMTAAGLSSVAICLEGLDLADRIGDNRAIEKGLQALGRRMLRYGYRSADHYGFYGVERACVLTGVKRFNDFDWYRAGAADLLGRQKPDGSFPPSPGGKAWRYGPAIDTAYALLFLKRATTPIAGVEDRGTVRVPTSARLQ